jgi:hypothetical protein
MLTIPTTLSVLSLNKVGRSFVFVIILLKLERMCLYIYFCVETHEDIQSLYYRPRVILTNYYSCGLHLQFTFTRFTAVNYKYVLKIFIILFNGMRFSYIMLSVRNS